MPWWSAQVALAGQTLLSLFAGSPSAGGTCSGQILALLVAASVFLHSDYNKDMIDRVFKQQAHFLYF